MTDKQDPIAHAARLLREAAEELRQAHAYNNSEGWENETDAKAAYDGHLAAAQALEDWEAAIGAGGVSGPLMGRASLSAQAEGWRPIETAPKGELVLLWSEITRGEPFIGDWAEYARYNHPQFTHWSRWDGLPPTSAEGVEHG
jgi:hypothetical protein